MWYEELAEELLSVRHGGARQFLIMFARDYAQGKALVLVELYKQQESPTPTELSSALNLSSGRIANILKSLQRSGHVSRQKDAEDGRRAHVVLTERGRAKAAKLYASQVEACGEMLCGLGEDDAKELVRILKKVPALRV